MTPCQVDKELCKTKYYYIEPNEALKELYFLRLAIFLLDIAVKFLTSPSGVSDGHNIPHCDGCSDRGPLTFLVFSN